MNKKTRALSVAEYHEIIDTMKTGFTGCRPNNRIATALVLQANLGLRIGDIIKLTLNSFIRDGERYRLDIVEEKTGKKREFTVPTAIYNYIKLYALENEIKSDDLLFPITERAVQKQLKIVTDFLELEGISTHSFRKFFATQIYINNGYNIRLVQQLLQHSNPNTTQRYIGISSKQVEDAISNHIDLI